MGFWELSDNIISLDQGAAAIAGLENDASLEFKAFLELLDPESRRNIFDTLRRALKTAGKQDALDCRVFNKKTKTWRWVRIVGESRQDGNKKQVLGAVQLIEEPSQLAEKVETLTRELARKDLLYQCVPEMAGMLLKAGTLGFENNFHACLELTARTVGLVRAYLYKNHLVDGVLHCSRVHEWAGEGEPALKEDAADSPYYAWPGLREVLEGGKNYNRLSKNIPREIKTFMSKKVQAVLFVPIFFNELFWGFMGYEHSLEKRVFNADEESVLSCAALLLANTHIHNELHQNLCVAVDKISTATIKAEEMEKAAYTDALTGIYNRRHFMDLAQVTLEKAKRFNSLCYSMMLDLDFFKKVNDVCGHLAGDEVLRNVSRVIKNALRSYDLLARYGGEEFVTLISDTKKDDVLNLAERVREAVANTPAIYNCIKIPCTISIGVAESFPDCTITSLIGRADSALYAAKEAGRNRVVYYPGD
jgi:diguanylate cyclase (GGDEF)-like protein